MIAYWKEALSKGTLTEGPRLDPAGMFEDVFKEVPDNLRRQREQMQRLKFEQKAKPIVDPR
jgi:hypothetical protein